MDRQPRSAEPQRRFSIRGWDLLQSPIELLTVLVLVDLVAATAVVKSIAGTPINGGEILRAAIVFFACIVFEEVARRIEVMRVRFGEALHADMTSVWTVAAALVLEPGYTVCIVVLVRAWIWFSYQRQIGMKLYRQIYNTATVVLACLAISAATKAFGFKSGHIPSDLSAAAVILIGIFTYTLVNRSLVVLAVSVATRTLRPGMVIGTWEDNAIELATLSLGGLTAVVLIGHPWLVILVFAPMLALQHSSLVKQFKEAAMTDGKTGLLNAFAWQELATRELARARRDGEPAALLMLDLDHFKLINDGYGHLAGDAVLRSVADAIKAELRDYDTVGRFGGEEFVVLLPNADTARSILIAQRLRMAIAEVVIAHGEPLKSPAPGLTASVGVASFPSHGFEVEELLRAADAALYRAKRLGRDRVVLWSPDAGSDVEQHA
jgi:diguanylate cyclase (GGDEF)-like protein